MANLIGLVAKYNNVNFATAKEMIEEEFYPSDMYYSATKVTKEYLDYLNIPEEEQGQVFARTEKQFAIAIDKQFSGLPNWYGIEDVYFKSHGNWASPEIEYKGHAMGDYVIEDYFWELYKEDCEEEGIEADPEDGFGKYMQDHEEEIKKLMLTDGCIEY